MISKRPILLLSTSPFLRHRDDTSMLMWQVNYSLIPVLIASAYYFGISALFVSAACLAGVLLPEWLLNRYGQEKKDTLMDGSAVITGLLLALTLPPGIPLWMAFMGGVIAVSLGKLLFGGIGFNIFNPALVGRAFLQAAFPVSLTTWTVPGNVSSFMTVQQGNLALPFLKTEIDAVTTATPLAMIKFESTLPDLLDLLLGSTGGSLGETSALIILLCGIYMGFRGVINWRIPVGILGTVFIFGAVLFWINPVTYMPPVFHLFSGGLMLGAMFMATDPVTSPITQRGCWVFGVGIGFLVVLIRTYGGLTEGIMYAILLMNAVTPLINRVTYPKIYGAQKAERSKG